MPSSTKDELGSFDRNNQFSSPETVDPETERIEDAIFDMLATDALPLSTVENEGFRNLMSILKPEFKQK